MKQIPLAIGPEPAPTFETFVPGANEAVLRQLRGLAWPTAPVYLWGPSGSGKTHLLRAWVQQLQSSGHAVAWFAAGTPRPWAIGAACAMVVVDDCQSLDANEQHAAFTLFIEAGQQGLQFAAAGRFPPVDLELREDLRTRLAWGHVLQLAPVSEPETRAALRREADRRGIFLSDDVMSYLLSRFERDLKHLMALLDRLDRFALAEGRAVTVPLIRRMLVEQGEGSPA